MCEKCVRLDRAIEDFRHQQKVVKDRLALTLIAMAIDQLESEKVALHPEKSKPARGLASSRFVRFDYVWCRALPDRSTS
jgi:hypothetical protein